MINFYKNKKVTGFVLLYAVLLVSIVLTISLSLYNITYRQLLLSSTLLESIKSFYVMDGAVDCVTYWGRTRGTKGGVVGGNGYAFGAFVQGYGPLDPDISNKIYCAEDDITLSHTQSGGYYSTNFTINNPSPDSACAVVKVMMGDNASAAINNNALINGYNLGNKPLTNECDDPTNPRRVERGVSLTIPTS